MNRNFNKFNSKNSRFKKEIQWILREKYGDAEEKIKKEDFVRLKKEEPVDYIIGSLPFLDVTIDLSLHPLVPRSETEYWTKKAIEDIKAVRMTRSALFTALDMFTGSGCVGVAILKYFSRSHIDFVDHDPRMLDQAEINAKQNSVLSRARFIQSDIFQNITTQYDYVFANPPYVDAHAMQKLPDSVRNFEPREALFGGEDGLLFIRKFLCELPRFLKEGGIAWMEFGFGQKMKIEKILRDISVINYTFSKDQYGRWRVLRVVKNKSGGARDSAIS